MAATKNLLADTRAFRSSAHRFELRSPKWTSSITQNEDAQGSFAPADPLSIFRGMAVAAPLSVVFWGLLFLAIFNR